jgi:hypothetical protein
MITRHDITAGLPDRKTSQLYGWRAQKNSSVIPCSMATDRGMNTNMVRSSSVQMYFVEDLTPRPGLPVREMNRCQNAGRHESLLGYCCHGQLEQICPEKGAAV